MKVIKLSHEQVTFVDDDIYEELIKFNWRAHWDSRGKRFYAKRTGRKRFNEPSTVSMHRIIMSAPKGTHVDHKSGDTLDNQRLNLRVVMPRENWQNYHVSKSSIYPGVFFDKKERKWKTRISINGIRKSLGCYSIEKDAFLAYVRACEENDFPTEFMLEKFGMKK